MYVKCMYVKRMYVCMYVCVNKYIYIYIYIYILLCLCLCCMFMYIYIYIYAHICTYINVYIHICYRGRRGPTLHALVVEVGEEEGDLHEVGINSLLLHGYK